MNKLYQKLFFLPVVITFAYFCLLLDTIKYPGFVGKHFLIDAKAYLAICVVLMLIFESKNRFTEWISKINLLILAASGLGYVYFSIEEAIHYPNYVLARFHFSLEGFIYIVIFSAAIFIAEELSDSKVIKKDNKDFGKIIIYFLITYTLIVNIGETLKNCIVGDVYIALHPRDSYGEKMHYRWDGFYDYMVFVRNNTPQNVNIVIPPQISPWLSSGNMVLDRYFLYPRKLIQYSDKQIPDIGSLLGDTYIMIYRGEWCGNDRCQIWPLQTIKANEVILKDSNSANVKEIRENFTYDPKDTNNPFGLLKI